MQSFVEQMNSDKESLNLEVGRTVLIMMMHYWDSTLAEGQTTRSHFGKECHDWKAVNLIKLLKLPSCTHTTYLVNKGLGNDLKKLPPADDHNARVWKTTSMFGSGA